HLQVFATHEPARGITCNGNKRGPSSPRPSPPSAGGEGDSSLVYGPNAHDQTLTTRWRVPPNPHPTRWHASDPSKMGRVRKVHAHDLRPALCPGGDGYCRAGQPGLAGVACVPAGFGGDGLRADVRHGL